MGAERNKDLLLTLLRSDGNDLCADCGNKDTLPDWASVSLGIFVCLRCSGIHRGLVAFKSVIRSVRLDKWTDEGCQVMAAIGNKKANERWEKNVPIVWERPNQDSHPALVKEWIHAKYERQEFTENHAGRQPYMEGSKKGTLYKRERRKSAWNSRWFVLCSKTHSLAYYVKKNDPEPIKIIKVTNLSVYLCDEKKTGKAESMQLCETVNGSNRNYFVYSDSTSDLIDWYLSIRAAKLKALDLDVSRYPPSLVSAILSHPFIMEGFLYKTGPKDNDGWKKRWISVDAHRFLYSENEMDSSPTGVVLGPEENGFGVREGMNGKHPDASFCFVVETPQRNFNFKTISQESLEKWIDAFKQGMSPFPTLGSLVRERLATAQDGLARLSIASYVSDESTGSFSDE